MAYKFQVATANIYVYNQQGNVKDSSNIYGMFNLNDTFTAEKTHLWWVNMYIELH